MNKIKTVEIAISGRGEENRFQTNADEGYLLLDTEKERIAYIIEYAIDVLDLKITEKQAEIQQTKGDTMQTNPVKVMTKEETNKYYIEYLEKHFLSKLEKEVLHNFKKIIEKEIEKRIPNKSS